ncbi:MAG: MFS transporter [Promethearchaeota archaeon]
MEQTKKKYSHLQPLWVAVFSDVLGFTILIPLFPLLISMFKVTPLEVGYTMSLNAIFGFIFGPILSHLSDKFGRKPLLLISQIGTLIGFAILAISQNIYWVYVSRIVDGIFGGNFPIAKAIIGDVVDPIDRSREMTNVGTAHNLANLIGPAIGGILSKSTGLVGPGLIAAFLSLITIIMTIFYIKETAPVKTGKKNIRVVPEGETTNNNNNGHSFIKNKYFLIILTIYLFHTLAFISNNSGFALFMSIKLNYNSQTIGLIFTIAGAFQLFIRFVIFYPLMKKIGEDKLLKLGLAIFIGVYFLIGFVSAGYQLIIILLFLSFAASSVRGILSSYLSRTVHPKQQGLAMGIGNSMDSIAQIVGPILSGFILITFNLNYYGFISGALSIVAFILIFIRIKFIYEKSDEKPKISENWGVE